MRSFRVHACNPDDSGRIPYVVVSLCGRDRVSLDMTGLQSSAVKTNAAVALSMNALYDLLQGKRTTVEREDGAFSFVPSGRWLVIHKQGMDTHKVWLAELALAWNMLAGYEATPINVRWNTQ